MENKYRTLFFKYMYDYLQLKNIEELFEKQGIRKIVDDKRNTNLEISGYFYLLNEINLDKLSQEEYEFLNTIDLDDKEIGDSVKNFLIRTYEKVLFVETEQDYVSYGPMTYQYMAPRDSIAIGVRYDKYGFASGDRLTLEQVDSNEEVLCDMLNAVQESNYDKIKVAFIRYNEFFGKIPELYDLGVKNK